MKATALPVRAGFWIAACWICGAAGGPAATAQTPPAFADAGAAAGVSAPHHASYFITGQTWGDYDRDGHLDLYVTDSAGPNTLYHNRGDGTFEVSPLNGQVSLTLTQSGGALFGDYDNDGWPDLYVLGLGANSLFHNDGGRGFTDVTAQAGVGDGGQGESAAWGDYDGDGLPDLYVVNWYLQEHEPSPLIRDTLYHNRGDGTFEDVTERLLDNVRTRGPGFAVTFLDYDNDGDSDLYVVNDKLFGNLLWRNDGPGCAGWCFTDVSVASGAHRPVWGMGVSAGDYDLDGDLDLYFSSIGEMVLLRNETAQGNPIFTEVSAAAGVTLDAIGWGTAFFDYDNDGWLDLFLSTMDADPARSDRLFHNRGDGTFEDVSLASGVSDPRPSLGNTYGDYDGDGGMDLVVGNFDYGYTLYRNQAAAASGRGWLRVELTGRGGVNRDALGARVTVETDDGRRLMQEVKSGSSLGAGHQLALHFGLGEALPTGLTITWPDGTTAAFSTPPLRRTWRAVYPEYGDAIFYDGFESGDLTSWAASTSASSPP